MKWTFKQIKPQKARGVLKESMWTDENWVAQRKYDGDRRIAQFCDGIVRFTGTRESVDGTGFVEKTANLPHLQPGTLIVRDGLRGKLARLEGTVLDGEMVPPPGTKIKGGGSKYVTSIMGSSPEEAVRKQQERGWLHYMVFDCLWYKGRDVQSEPFYKRRAWAAQAILEWRNPYASTVMSVLMEKKKYFEGLVAEGGEGVILKHLDHTYGDEKLWVKVKAEWTADVVIMGFEEGKGKYAGNVGAIVFGQYVPRHGHPESLALMRMGTCSGVTDQMRDSFYRHGKKYLGRVMEIKHNGREPTGAFRHPRWSRFRDDKNPFDCVYRKDET